MELKQIIDAIHMMTLEETNEVFRAVNQRRSYMTRVSLKVGDTVEFDAGPRRGMRRGQIIKQNPTRYRVRTTDGVLWNVTPNLLKKVNPTVSA